VPSDIALEVKGLTAGYGAAPVIRDVSLRVGTGTITAIVGPNGAGKSTLLKSIFGIIRPSHGSVLLYETDVTSKPSEQLVHEGMAYVPQVANVFPSLTVMENLEMGGYTRRAGVRERALKMCQLFPDLTAALKRPARTLSGGQRSMLAIARGLMTDPKILILDEPTAGLAPRFEDAVWEHVLTVQRLGVAILIVDQNTRRCLAAADWAYVMVDGQNRIDGLGRDLLGDPNVVSMFVGAAAQGAS
jgi:branched-chain amino acid transport system ATP-binding protein